LRIDSYNKKIAALIVIFPPILLIVYAIVSYTIFFTSETTSDKYILSFSNPTSFKYPKNKGVYGRESIRI